MGLIDGQETNDALGCGSAWSTSSFARFRANVKRKARVDAEGEDGRVRL